MKVKVRYNDKFLDGFWLDVSWDMDARDSVCFTSYGNDDDDDPQSRIVLSLADVGKLRAQLKLIFPSEPT